MSEYSNELIEKLKKAQNVEEVAELLKTYCQNGAEAKKVWEKMKSLRAGEQELSPEEFATVAGGVDWPDEPCWDIVKRPW